LKGNKIGEFFDDIRQCKLVLSPPENNKCDLVNGLANINNDVFQRLLSLIQINYKPDTYSKDLFTEDESISANLMALMEESSKILNLYKGNFKIDEDGLCKQTTDMEAVGSTIYTDVQECIKAETQPTPVERIRRW
jgi:hypothetical protein